MDYQRNNGEQELRYMALEHEQRMAALVQERERIALLSKPHVIYDVDVFQDGDMWCALLGLNIAEGVCGFGDSPAAACAAFDEAWLGKSPKPEVKPDGS